MTFLKALGMGVLALYLSAGSLVIAAGGVWWLITEDAELWQGAIVGIAVLVIVPIGIGMTAWIGYVLTEHESES